MKTCLKCQKIKELDKFPNKTASKDGKHPYCKECKSTYYDHKYWKQKKEKGLPTNESRKKNREWVNDYKKSLQCAKCGESRYYVLDFHHTEPDKKDGNISEMLGRHSIKRVQDEIRKCIVLCKNCHGEFHYMEREQNTTINEYLSIWHVIV
jgi:hypothetical protein